LSRKGLERISPGTMMRAPCSNNKVAIAISTVRGLSYHSHINLCLYLPVNP